MRRIQGDFAREIERHAERRLPAGPERGLEAAVLGNAISGALLAALRVWGERGGDDTDELRDMTARALELLREFPAWAGSPISQGRLPIFRGHLLA